MVSQMKINVTLGSVWAASDMKKFIVQGVEQTGADVWVSYYEKENPNKQYKCLVDAFTQRFGAYENDGR